MAPTHDPDDPTNDPTLAGFVKDSRTPLQRFMEAKSPVKVIDDFPGAGERWKGFAFGLRALTVEEVQTAAIDATKELTDRFKLSESLLFTSIADEMRDISSKVHILARSMTHAEAPHERLFKGPNELRAALEADELHALFELYMDWQRERSPVSSAKSLDDVMGVVEAMGKGMAPSSALNGYDAATLRYIVTVLAQERQALLTASTSTDSSSTPPQSESEESLVTHSGY